MKLKLVAGLPHICIDAKYFVQYHDGARRVRACGARDIGVKWSFGGLNTNRILRVGSPDAHS